MACFFLVPLLSYARESSWRFDEDLERIYRLAINLQTDQARALLDRVSGKENDLYKMYLQSLCESLDVFIGEDLVKFDTMEKNFRARLKILEAMPQSAETLFLRAELALHKGFNQINLGQEISAVFAIRQAYNLTEECLKKYPNFIPIKKTDGVMQVMVGSVPDKYHWFISLLGMKGTVAKGQKQLNELRTSAVSLNLEATIVYYAVKGLINQQIDEAAKGLSERLKIDPDNRLVMFLAVNMLVKNSQSEDAYALIENLDLHNSGLMLPYIEYIRGEILMQKNRFDEAIAAYEKFIRIYRADSFKKDATVKIALCYHLLGNTRDALNYWEKAKTTGKVKYDPDISAASFLSERPFPNEKILRVRIYTDGGYFKEARAVLQTITPADLKTHKDQVEYYYRKARLAHKTHDLAAAELFYTQTITMMGDNPWYFGANSALQLGYIYQEKNRRIDARSYFEKALSYKKHEYKNSIDSKAKSALEQLPESK